MDHKLSAIAPTLSASLVMSYWVVIANHDALRNQAVSSMLSPQQDDPAIPTPAATSTVIHAHLNDVTGDLTTSRFVPTRPNNPLHPEPLMRHRTRLRDSAPVVRIGNAHLCTDNDPPSRPWDSEPTQRSTNPRLGKAVDTGWAMAKQRARRGETPLPAATVVIRGDLLDPDVLAESAQRNFGLYGFCGISGEGSVEAMFAAFPRPQMPRYLALGTSRSR
jgi:hypothetical protein